MKYKFDIYYKECDNDGQKWSVELNCHRVLLYGNTLKEAVDKLKDFEPLNTRYHNKEIISWSCEETKPKEVEE